MRTAMLIALSMVMVALAGAEEGRTAKEKEKEAGFVSLFDGKSLTGWKAAEENPESFQVKDGILVVDGGRSHLYYVGPVAQHEFKNVELKLEVMTTKGSNSGVYFHSGYAKKGWPAKGHECQVNSTHGDWRKTGSLYSIRDIKESPSKDNEWFSYHIIVKSQRVLIKVNGKTMVDYTEPEGLTRKERPDGEIIGHGTFAFQAHDPKSITYYRNIRVKVLEDK